MFTRGMDKEDVVYIYIYTHTHTHTHTMEYYLAIKNEIMTWMDLEILMLSEVRERQIYDITYIWNLKKMV